MKRIVILTDDARTKRTIRTALDNPDCELLDSQDPVRVLEDLRRGGVSCTLVDCNTAHLSREMAHLIQYSAAISGVPVVWISHYGERDPLVRDLQLGAFSVLSKPFSEVQLLQRVQQCFWIGPCVPTDIPSRAMRLA